MRKSTGLSTACAVIIILCGAVLTRPHATQAASLKDLEAQLQNAEDNLAKYQDLQQKEQNKASNYADTISQTQNEIQSVKSTIQSLEGSIADKQKNIETTSDSIDQQIALIGQYTQSRNDAIATYYELTNLSSTEMLADNQSISHFNDRTEYIQSLQDSIVDDITKISQVKQDLEANKAKLEQQKNELAAMEGDQINKKIELTQTQNQNYNLLNQAKANQAQYAALAQQLQAQKHDLDAKIYAMRIALSRKNRETYGGGSSGYPWHVGAHQWVVDPWGFYEGECTSYAAWKFQAIYGTPFNNTRPGDGDAWNWPALARDQGYRVLKTPKVGAIVSWPIYRAAGMYYGHVAYVEGINADGTINVSEYNWASPHSFGTRENVRWQDYGNASFIVP